MILRIKLPSILFTLVSMFIAILPTLNAQDVTKDDLRESTPEADGFAKPIVADDLADIFDQAIVLSKKHFQTKGSVFNFDESNIYELAVTAAHIKLDWELEEHEELIDDEPGYVCRSWYYSYYRHDAQSFGKHFISGPILEAKATNMIDSALLALQAAFLAAQSLEAKTLVQRKTHLSLGASYGLLGCWGKESQRNVLPRRAAEHIMEVFYFKSHVPAKYVPTLLTSRSAHALLKGERLRTPRTKKLETKND